MSIEKWSTIASGVAAVVGVFLGAVGIWIGLNALEFTRKIETARLQPLLVFHTDTSAESQSISIINRSDAPALVQNVSYRAGDGDYFGSNDWTYAAIHNVLGLDHFSQTIDPNSEIYLGWMNDGSFIGGGETVVMLQYEAYGQKSPHAQAVFTQIFNDIRRNGAIRISYCDMLGENCRTMTHGGG